MTDLGATALVWSIIMGAAGLSVLGSISTALHAIRDELRKPRGDK